MMNIDMFMTMNLAPFSSDFEEDVLELLDYNNYNIFIAIKLFCIYFEKLVQHEMKLQYSVSDFIGIQVGYMKKREYRDSMAEIMEKIGGTLWSVFISWSSFQEELINLSEIELIMDVDTEDLLSWDDSKRIESVRKYQEQLLEGIQVDLFEKAPEPVIDSFDFPYHRATIYLYSEKVSKYLDFAERNGEVIQNQFAQEHQRIEQALLIVERPVAEEWVKCYAKKDRDYIIGFYAGEDMENGVTMRNLNWNFFVALYVLEKLLETADEFFHFYNER